MIIGVPREIMRDEARVAASPEAIKQYVTDGHTVLFERGAGGGAAYHDEDYQTAGAELMQGPEEIFRRAEIIIRVKEPLLSEQLSKHEIDMVHKGQYFITFIHPASPVNRDIVRKMAAQSVIGLTLDGMPRISRVRNLDALTSIGTYASYKGILMAANGLSFFIPQTLIVVGKIDLTGVLVIGVGTAGLRTLATARRLDRITYTVGIRPVASEQTTSLGVKPIDLGIPADKAVAPGGYALYLNLELLEYERKVLADYVKDMDIVFCNVLVPSKIAPVAIIEEMVRSMKPDSVIVDIVIDQGGNCTITTPGERDVKHRVVTEDIKNIPDMFPQSATWMFSRDMYSLVKCLAKDDKMHLDMSDQTTSSIIVTTEAGETIHKGILEAIELKK